MQPRPGISGKLVAIYLVIAIPLIAVIALNFIDRYQTGPTLVLQERTNAAILTADSFTVLIREIGVTMEANGREIVDNQYPPDKAALLLRRLLVLYPAAYAILTDPSGVVVASTDPTFIGQNFGKDEPFAAIVQGKQQLNIEPVEFNQTPVGFHVTRAVRMSDGSLQGIVAVYIDISKLKKAFSAQVATGETNIIDSSGYLVYDSEFPNLPQSKSFWGNEVFVRRALSGERATSTNFIHPATKTARLIAEVPVKQFGWAAGSSADKNEALAPISRSLVYSILTTSAVLLISLLVSILIARRIIGSLAMLVGAARAVGQGRFDEPITLATGDEIEDLAHSLDEARLSLKTAVEKLEQSFRLSDALNSINAATTSTLDFDEIMQRVIIEASKTLGAEIAAIALHENGRWIARYTYGPATESVGMELPPEEVAYAESVAMAHEPVAIADAYNDPRVDSALMRKCGIRSILAIPLAIRDEVIGVLRFSFLSPVFLAQAEIDFVNKLAALISLALENAHLYDELTIRNADLQSVLDVALDITSGLQLDEIMYKIAKNATELTGADLGAVGLVDKRTGGVTYPFIYNLPEIITKTEIAPGMGLSGTTIQNKRPFIIEDYQKLTQKVPAFAEAGLRATAIIPLVSRGEIVGALFVSSRTPEKRFSDRDVEVLEGVGRHASIALENARLYEAERHIADTLQESLITVPESIKGISYGYLYRSATEAAKVGGDFYDIFELEHDRIGVIVGDVSGSGIEAAALTNIVKNTIKAHAYEDDTPSGILFRANNLVTRISPPASFVTVFFGILNKATGELLYCSGGHPPAIIKRHDGTVELLTNGSPFIGAFPELEYATSAGRLNHGDTLIIYTDGITEARCQGEFFGQTRLLTLVEAIRPAPAKELPEVLFSEIMRCTHGRLFDDVVLIAISLGD